MATTTNLGLTKPTVGADDDTWGTIQNTLSDGIDAVFAAAGSGTSVGIKVGTGKTLNALDGTVVLGDAGLTIKDTSDPTKIAAFQCSGITAGQTRTFTFPDVSDSLVTLTATQTLTNKTLTAPALGAATATSVNFGAQTLSTYANGTFTPGISFGGGATGITYSIQSGAYVKIGKLVICTIGVTLSNKGSSTGVARVTGLPYTSTTGSHQYGVGAAISGSDISYTGTLRVGSYLTGSATTLDVIQESGGSITHLTDAAFSNTTNLYFTVSYIATAE